MGADGGICWVPLKIKSDKAKARAHELLGVFFILFSEEGGWIGDANSDWYDRNPWIYKWYLHGESGTNRDYSLEDLRELCYEDEDATADDSQTFEELLLDLETRPAWQAYARTKLERMVWEYCRYDFMKDKFDKIKDIRISDWVIELNSLLDIKRIGYDETWT